MTRAPPSSPRTRASLCVLTAALAMVAAGIARGEDLLVAPGSTWRYLDDGSDQGAAWQLPGFDDSSWAVGPAQLGYGDGDEATVVDYGPDPDDKYVTTYLRHHFDLSDASQYVALRLELLRDDGAVLYLNGTELRRDNLPDGTITYDTLATIGVGIGVEWRYFPTYHDPTLLTTGTNVLAVEVHQVHRSNDDLSIDLSLIGKTAADPVEVVRGPYLQSGSEEAAVLRWRTDSPTMARVRYGATPDLLDHCVDDPTVGFEHEVVVAGLDADTRYYYSVGNATDEFAGADDEHLFRTAPETGQRQPLRMWVIGDSGTASPDARAVRDAYLSATGDEHTDVWLMLGDNAYNTGTQFEYQDAVFDTYAELLRNTILWPTLGNHDAHNASSPDESGVYYDVFTLPRAGESGGVASGTEAYYSFDWGNVHFVNLDSMDTDRSPSGPMFTWLANDLGQTTQEWVVAFFHHPPYTKGSHDSDFPGDSGGRMVDMREIALPLLEDHGVDLVLCGHSHSYERSFLLDGHYDESSTLRDEHRIDDGDGREDGDGAYRKVSQTLAPHEGAVYVVAGCASKTSFGPLDHPAMYFGEVALGSVVLELDGNRLDASFLRETGVVDDWFTLIKGPRAPVVDPRSLTAPFADGTPGDLLPAGGGHQVVNEGLEISERASFRLPATRYRHPRLLAQVAAGMPAQAWVGASLDRLRPPDRPGLGGGRDLEARVQHLGSGNVQASLWLDGSLLVLGSPRSLQVDVDPFTLRISVDGERVRVHADRARLLDHRLGFAYTGTRVALEVEPAGGRVRLESVLARERGRPAGVHFDQDGNLWIGLMDQRLFSHFDPATFVYREEEKSWDWNTFQTEVVPRFDRVEGADPHHILLGLTVEHFSPGTHVEIEAQGHSDEDVRR